MSIAMYSLANQWQLWAVFLDVVIFALGMVIQHFFPSKYKLIAIGSSCVILLCCLLGGVLLNYVVPSESLYVIAYIASGLCVFVLGAIIYNCILVAEPTLFGVHNLNMVYELVKLFNKPYLLPTRDTNRASCLTIWQTAG